MGKRVITYTAVIDDQDEVFSISCRDFDREVVGHIIVSFLTIEDVPD